MKFGLVLLLFLSGCTNLFFLPDKGIRLVPSELGLSYQNLTIPLSEQDSLFAWKLRSSKPAKGTVVHFHGNAENISTHITGVYWIPASGYDVLTVDYRGYGGSSGKASLSNALSDVASTLRWAACSEEIQKPLFVFGQSIGGALSIRVLADPSVKDLVAGAIFDGSFSSYRKIAREKLAVFWLTTLFRWPLSFLISDRESPERFIASLSPLPVVIAHGEEDGIVPSSHASRLFGAASAPKELWLVPGAGHIESFAEEGLRRKFIESLDLWTRSQRAETSSCLGRAPQAD